MVLLQLVHELGYASWLQRRCGEELLNALAEDSERFSKVEVSSPCTALGMPGNLDQNSAECS